MDSQINIEDIKKNIKKYYQYAQALHHFTNLIAQTTNAKDKSAYYICLDGFATRLSNYCLSIYEELTKDELELYKANSNRIYIRGCLESCLILNILLSRPNLAQNFMNNLTYDAVRINNVYKKSSKARNGIYTEFDNIVLEGKPQKRFGWLPRYKGKKALNMTDLLNYINFENENKKNYYEMLIRSSDNFSHPSFYIPNTVLSNMKEKNIEDINILTNEYGILNECIHIISQFLKDFFETNSQIKISNTLNAILDDNLVSNNKSLSFLQINDYILGANESISHIDAAAFFKKRIDIDKKLSLRNINHPQQIKLISEDLEKLSYAVLKTQNSYYHKNIGLLLLDSIFRIDDLFKAYYDFNLLSFYTQIRYLIELVVTINILNNEDNERNKIYYIHQYIKGYQAKNTIKNFLNSQSNNLNKYINDIFDEDTKRYNETIDYIINYYKTVHNHDIDRNNTVRLNAWALCLNGLDNEYILNLPSLLNFSVSNLMNDISNELKNHNANVDFNITDYVLGLYEESCAYSHVTPYAWVNNIKLYKNRYSFKEQFLIILLIILELFKELDSCLSEHQETVNIDGIDSLLNNVFNNYQELILPFLTDFINENIKKQ